MALGDQSWISNAEGEVLEAMKKVAMAAGVVLNRNQKFPCKAFVGPCSRKASRGSGRSETLKTKNVYKMKLRFMSLYCLCLKFLLHCGVDFIHKKRISTIFSVGDSPDPFEISDQ